LFLDVDGSLIELAPSPDAVHVPAWLPLLLDELSAALGGALAVISGRSLEQIDRLLAPWRAVGAGIHGAELRWADQTQMQTAGHSLQALVERLRLRLTCWPEVRVEDKGIAVAVHYAQCPALAERCEMALIEETLHLPELRLQRGRCVIEALPAERDKGLALRNLMVAEPFSGRTPVFVGDDHTDEAAFKALHGSAGFGVKVGAGPTAAQYRLDTPEQVCGWLRAGLRVLRAEAKAA
jgi:trehalose 6-phosphate phosphatase